MQGNVNINRKEHHVPQHGGRQGTVKNCYECVQDTEVSNVNYVISAHSGR